MTSHPRSLSLLHAASCSVRLLFFFRRRRLHLLLLGAKHVSRVHRLSPTNESRVR